MEQKSSNTFWLLLKDPNSNKVQVQYKFWTEYQHQEQKALSVWESWYVVDSRAKSNEKV